MGYQVKWVEEKLGVSRKALRIFEDKGLMPKNKGLNRNYSEGDLRKIWLIRTFQGMGYTLNEIVGIVKDETFDFHSSISKKIIELERNIADKEKHLRYAKNIKYTGKLPMWPKEIGTVKFDDFYDNAVEGWSKFEFYGDEVIENVLKNYTDNSIDTKTNSSLNELVDLVSRMDLSIEQYTKMLLAQEYLNAIANRHHLSPENPEVQLLVKFYYDSMNAVVGIEISKKQFGRLHSGFFLEGDISLKYKEQYGVEKCKFIADSIAFFGGFKDYEETLIYIT